MKENKTVIAYLRVSGRNQITGSGFDRQSEKIKHYCKKNKFTIAEIFREQVSGTKGEEQRPQFMAMVNCILSNGVRTVVVESLDRLARTYAIQEQILFYLASKNIDLISADSGENITQEIKKDPIKKAIVAVQGIFAELEKSRLVSKLKDGRDKKRKATGRCEGEYRYGTVNPKCPDRAEREQEILRFIAHERQYVPYGSRGRTKPQMSYRAIADHLNAKGPEFAPKKGAKWMSTTVSYFARRARKLGLQ